MTNKDTNKYASKYENLVIHCKYKGEWDWVFDNLPEGYSDRHGIQNMYNQYYTCLRLCQNGVCYSTLEIYKRLDSEYYVKAIISFQEYKQMILQDRQEECNQYQVIPEHKTLKLLSKNIATFTKAAKLAGIEENELDNYSKLLIELSVGGIELSWTFHPNL